MAILKMKWPFHILLVGFFLVIATLVTYPLIVDLQKCFPGVARDTDVISFIWNQWWTRYSILKLHQSPLESNYVFAPFDIDLRLHTYGLLYGLVGIPFQPLLGVVGTFNLTILFTAILNGYTTTLLVKQLINKYDLGIIIGTAVMVNPAITFNLRVGRPSFASIWPIALCLLSMVGLIRSQRVKYALGLGLALLMALLLDFQILLFCSLWVVLLGVYWLIAKQAQLRFPTLLRSMFLVFLIVGVPFLIIYYPALFNAGGQGYPLPSDTATIVYSYRWWDYFNPAVLIPTFGYAVPIATAVSLFAFIVLLVKSLFNRINPQILQSKPSLLDLKSDGHPEIPNSVWAIGSLIFLILSLGVVLKPTDLPLPFMVLRKLPGMAHFRTPYRFNMSTILGISIALGVTQAHRLLKYTRPLSRTLLLLIIIFLLVIDSRTTAPFPVQRYPEEHIYERIADQPGDFLVMEIPLGLRTGIQSFGDGQVLQYYQIIHEKRGINGMIARVPRQVFDYYRNSIALSFFAGDPINPEPDLIQADLTTVIAALKVKYLIMHPQMMSVEMQRQVFEVLSGNVNFRLIEQSPTIVAFEVTE
jgi:hypothetical protein